MTKPTPISSYPNQLSPFDDIRFEEYHAPTATEAKFWESSSDGFPDMEVLAISNEVTVLLDQCKDTQAEWTLQCANFKSAVALGTLLANKVVTPSELGMENIM